jgi:DNA-binding NarL/FixJ family response regulator
MIPKTVVVVEDDEATRSVVRRTLQRDRRIQVVAAVGDARQAIAAIRGSAVDAVVLDHYISGRVMGLESIPAIKTLAPEAKVIVFTAQDLELEAYLEPEVDAYVHKGDVALLLPTLQRVLDLPVELDLRDARDERQRQSGASHVR